MIGDAIQDGLIDPRIDPRTAAAQLAGLTDGLIVEILIDPEHPDVTRLAVDAVDALITSWTIAASVVY